MRQRQKL